MMAFRSFSGWRSEVEPLVEEADLEAVTALSDDDESPESFAPCDDNGLSCSNSTDPGC